jgi:putative restriction endonuclease
MFDRGLISVDSDFRILTAKNLVPEPIGRLIHPSGYLIVPESERQWPQRRFLEYHRDKIFKDSRN